jgi:hypothetical protein
MIVTTIEAIAIAVGNGNNIVVLKACRTSIRTILSIETCQCVRAQSRGAPPPVLMLLIQFKEERKGQPIMTGRSCILPEAPLV